MTLDLSLSLRSRTFPAEQAFAPVSPPVYLARTRVAPFNLAHPPFNLAKPAFAPFNLAILFSLFTRGVR